MTRVVHANAHRAVAASLVAFAAGAGLTDGAETEPSSAIRHSHRVALSASPDAVAVSSDGNTMIVASGRVLTAIGASSGNVLHRWEQSKDIVDISASANGRLVAVTTGSPIIDVYDKETGERSQQLHRADAPVFLRADGQQRIAFYPNGTKLISSGSRSRVFVSDVKTGDWDHINWVKYDTCTPVVSPDGKHVALFGMQDDSELSGQVTMFLVRRGLQPLWTKWHASKEAVTHAAFSPDGRRLVSSGAGDGVRVWNVESGKLIAHVRGEPESESIDLGGDGVARTKRPNRQGQPGPPGRLLGASFVADRSHLLMVSPRALQLRKLGRKTAVASRAIPENESLRGSAGSHDSTVVVTFSSGVAVDVWSVHRP